MENYLAITGLIETFDSWPKTHTPRDRVITVEHVVQKEIQKEKEKLGGRDGFSEASLTARAAAGLRSTGLL